jgi:c-di-AMP phosphodiesterase-like protein
MLESECSETTLLKEEADVLLSGIMLDTMNFTRTTGMRTFSAAYFLRAAGASSERARGFFEDDLEQHLAEAKFFDPESVVIYKQSIAIAVSMGYDEKYDRVAASKAAEKLISTRGVLAAFALVKIGSAIHISARSTGKVNVQLILERLFGGGHFDMAGAQLRETSLEDAYEQLKAAIDDYYLYDYVKSDDN